MLKYLNYIKSVVSTIYDIELRKVLEKEVEIYMDYWLSFASSTSRSPLYHSTPLLCDEHFFHLPTGNTVSISWDICKLYSYAENMLEINFLSLNEFESMTLIDRENSGNEFEVIANEVRSIQEHKYVPILTMNFKPTNNILILDGRHRYEEYRKFKRQSLLPTYLLDDEDSLSSIIQKNDLLTYILLHNIEVINNFLLGRESLDRIMNLERCMA